jgi:hypothetical protein
MSVHVCQDYWPEACPEGTHTQLPQSFETFVRTQTDDEVLWDLHRDLKPGSPSHIIVTDEVMARLPF